MLWAARLRMPPTKFPVTSCSRAAGFRQLDCTATRDRSGIHFSGRTQVRRDPGIPRRGSAQPRPARQPPAWWRAPGLASDCSRISRVPEQPLRRRCQTPTSYGSCRTSVEPAASAKLAAGPDTALGAPNSDSPAVEPAAPTRSEPLAVRAPSRTRRIGPCWDRNPATRPQRAPRYAVHRPNIHSR